ncbi:alcohol dehydrogenase catalytic domain-containing protein [Neobacillus sp. MM2021_6]|uniref:alcohol dehydrogenase catalytic domain-containing protein n=1 Tax=Bacillaceae TaxID=186817 RepID=UPI00140DD48D|nr:MULTISPECIES: alcohol dehydrogenase catalytic domain-containing protein [Bacillaceae]MBO0958810.1 alcohol dehydrogenase catalytic domain-containing protein [Neobacillus sp. MM2021_6]NHC20035.1 alcohol dehydrogenase catalytic domain-containing protein [Bacillus sp. MM2020_4]
MQQKAATTVMSRTFRLVKPGEVEEMAIERTIRDGEVVIEPSIASICHADLRYYLGQRRAEALEKKLPMALLHEGIGKVIVSKANDLKVGQRVVIVPNIPGSLIEKGVSEDCSFIRGNDFRENYSEKNEFLGSGYDGIAQNCLVLPAQCAIPIPDSIPDEIAVLCELCTVSYRAISRVKEQLMASNTKVAVFGDGPVGYLTAALINRIYGLDSTRLKVFGAIPDKLAHFHFADCSMVQDFDFCSAEKVDIVVECTGGKFSESAVNQGIDLLKRGGSLILMGVTEDRVPINTRDVLEKGLSLYGSSRSSIPDFQAVVSAMQDREYQKLLRAILPTEFTPIRTVNDFKEAMDSAGQHRGWKKVILEFNWAQ